ncbi:hypothetical protein [Chengkuizengella axinellae]|uniref:Uncharacterized protein n=1 Tax=Chengkuizengella axinellae TaxID=3064388 RepID=A0ABT9J6I2_9BACL|nr:hypothetical protein [Chengkuizengella sp. 2205SS18-9]MDP5277078.1 hypothetical protein [Chengkuizengella sp. 2205SS18-9]
MDSNELLITGYAETVNEEKVNIKYFEKVNESTIKKTFYNNIIGEYDTGFFEWDGTQFVLKDE